MANIKLSDGFSVMPEGTYVFKITDAKYEEKFGKLTINMVTYDGKKHTERYGLIKSNGQPNEGAYNAFSFFARTVMNDYTLEDIDPSKLIGRYFEGTVEHTVTESNKTPGKMLTFAHITDKFPADGFLEDLAKGKVATPSTSADEINFDDLLG